MTDDIVKRLRGRGASEVNCLCGNPVCVEAADEIERLRAALTKIAAEAYVTHGPDKHMWKGWRKIATDRIDVARAAISPPAKDDTP